MAWSSEEQREIREEIFRWLEHQEVNLGGYEFTREFLRTAFSHNGENVPLMDRQNGIWNPQGFDSTLSVTRTLKGNDRYSDELEGVIQKYSYEKLPGRPLVSGRNVKLRAAAASGVPIILFQEIFPARYLPRYPVFIVGDDPSEGYVSLALDDIVKLFEDPLNLTVQQKAYAERVTLTRLHQKSFRSRVLHAYRAKCAVCELSHSELLDAAHITPDSFTDSTTSISNGLALCNIHHAAYDRKVLGIDPDYCVHIRPDILSEVNGPMLKYGLQAMEGRTLSVPLRREERPDPVRLYHRFLEFAQ